MGGRARGTKFIGIQQGLHQDDTLVLFQPPSRQITLAVPLKEFSNPEKAVACVRVKILTAEKKWSRYSSRESQEAAQ